MLEFSQRRRRVPGRCRRIGVSRGRARLCKHGVDPLTSRGRGVDILYPSQLDGIFNDDNPANPVKDWSFVYIPYCTGDLHAGSSTQTYTSPTGNAALQIPPGYTFTLHHKGFDNFMVVLDWIKKNIDTPKRVLVTGVSGGGYGASINFPWVAQTYPNAHLYVIADSSQGVTPPGWDVSPVGRGHWNLQLAPWVFGNNPALVRSADVLSIGALTYSHAKVAQFTTAQDAVQTGFYGLMRSEGYPTGGTCPLPPPDWNELMLGALQLHAATVPNYRYYVAGGSYHTILESPSFYTEASPGSTYSDWVAGMLANRGGTNGSGGHWHSEACPTCLTPLPCQ